MITLIHPSAWIEVREAIPPWFIPALAFIFGSMAGSFLNVCICRLPRGESIVMPRSHCVACGHAIRWYDNIPLVSYFVLGGHCRDCGVRFSIRYWVVELTTAILFLFVWRTFSPWQALAYSVFTGGLIAATFIDFELFIIPDEITFSGIAAGIVCSGLIPDLHHTDRHLVALLWSLGGAVAGYLVLWVVVEGGKRIFGTKKEVFSEPTAILLTKEGIRIGEKLDRWDEIFSRPTDELVFEAADACCDERTWPQAAVRVNWQEIRVGEEVFPLENFGELHAATREILVPREAMGFGDVKFLAAIGAFLGPQAILFVILVSSVFGSFVGMTLIFSGKKHWGMKLPYGPYLALAAFVWLFGGSFWFARYLQWLGWSTGNP